MSLFLLAQVVAPSPSFGQHLLDLVLSPTGIAAAIAGVLSVVGLVLGGNAARRRHVALAIHHGFLIAEDIAAETTGEDVVDKIAAALKAADQYAIANGWRPLKPGEVEVGKMQFQALNGAQKVAEKVTVNAMVEAALPKPAP